MELDIGMETNYILYLGSSKLATMATHIQCAILGNTV